MSGPSMINRRNLLAAAGTAAISAPSLAALAQPGHWPLAEDFAPYVGSRFHLEDEAGHIIEAELVEVSPSKFTTEAGMSKAVLDRLSPLLDWSGPSAELSDADTGRLDPCGFCWSAFHRAARSRCMSRCSAKVGRGSIVSDLVFQSTGGLCNPLLPRLRFSDKGARGWLSAQAALPSFASQQSSDNCQVRLSRKSCCQFRQTRSKLQPKSLTISAIT